MASLEQLRRVLVGDLEAPKDLLAERAVLGWMLATPAAVEEAMTLLVPADFWDARHEKLFALIVGEYRNDKPTDLVSILSRAMPQTTHLDGLYLHELMESAVGDLKFHAGRVREKALLRSLVQVGVSAVQRALRAPDSGRTPEALIELLRTDLDLVDRRAVGDESHSTPILDFVETEITHNWLVEDFLEHQERLIITAPEGAGKSTWLRQIAVCVAAGVHPLKLTPSIPRTGLIVDCENPPGLNQRRYRPLLTVARKNGWAGDGLWIDSRPEGLDLTASADAAWLVRRVRRVDPDFLVVGPIYKIMSGDPNDEQVARKVTKIIDYIRGHFDVAVLMEAHSPHGTERERRPVRPYGASLWRRWPDHGLGLRPLYGDSGRVCELVAWKARDERPWPAGLRAGGDWPWVPLTADELNLERERGNRT